MKKGAENSNIVVRHNRVHDPINDIPKISIRLTGELERRFGMEVEKRRP